MRKLAFACVAVCVATAVAAQNLWQDGPYLHSYDAYFDCYEGVINNNPIEPNDRVAAERMFRRAFSECADARIAGTAGAEARVAALRPDYSPRQRRDTVSFFRRGLVVLRLGEFFRRKGLGAQFSEYFARTSEF
ncbi:MAG: hypothetical protein QOH47_1873 [Sphingomonadales bacterium]|jgi:hypothetical protein|nr:hypothetical protein [Sphingomonadales bacterium]